MSQLFYSLKTSFIRLKGSIAFYPTFLALAIAVIGILLMAIENNSTVASDIEEHFPLIISRNINTSGSILSTLIAVIISLMVFSFSTVMVVLNQAANNFSPRLLPRLISNRRHQLVLGVYLGTILHCMIALLRMEPSDYDSNLPSLGVLFAMVLGMICLALFVYFIHSISQSIQVSKIIYASIRQYVRHNSIIMGKLLKMLPYLKEDEQQYDEQIYQSSITEEAQILMEDVHQFIKNSTDSDYLFNMYKEYNFE